jgi:hypothetical protein
MTTEDRLRDALSATAQLVRSGEEEVVVPLRPRGRGRRFGPLAAAASVLLIVMASVLFHAERRQGPAMAPGPRYFVVTGAPQEVSYLTVRDARTGKKTATVNAPPGDYWRCTSSTPDPHVFYAALYQGAHPESTAHLRRLTIDDAGRVRQLTSDLRTFRAGSRGLTDCAISPDGNRVAFRAINPAKKGERKGPAEVDVVNLSDGRRSVYRTSVTGDVGDVSWAADGRHLGFDFMPADHSSYSICVLDTQAGHDLLAASHRVTLGGPAATETYQQAVLSADGGHFYVLESHGDHRNIRILELDARTGGQQRVLYERQHLSTNRGWSGLADLALNSTGTGLMLVDQAAGVHRVDIATGRVVDIKFPARDGSPSHVSW